MNANTRLVVRLVCLFMALAVGGCAGQQAAQRQKQAEVARELGEAYLRQNNTAAALRELLRAEKLMPDDPKVHNSLGLAYMSKRRYAQAASHFQKAIELKPDYSEAKNNLGAVYLALRNWDAAIEILAKIPNDLLYPTPHFPLTNLGYAYFNKGDLARAESYYKQALDLEPNFALALRGLARTYLAMGRADRALEPARRLVKLAPDQPAFQLLLAQVLEAAGKKDAAWQAYGKVIRLAPESQAARTAEQALGRLE